MSVRRIQTPEAFAELYQPARYKVFWGGRGGAKSTAFADALLAQADEQPLRILCAREIQDSIRESVHQLIADRAKAGRYPFEVKNSEIVHPNGSRFFFAGLWRNIDSIKSIEGVDIVWVEEASRVSEESWRKLIPTIRKTGSEIWATFNPELKSDPVYQRFVINPPPGAVVRKVSWRDNPWFTKELRDELEHLKRTDYDQYTHIWEGELRTYADGAVYAKQLRQAREEGRICRLPIQPAEEVNVFYDLGKSDATSAWFHQRIGPDDRFIDYMEWTGADIDEIAKGIKAKGYNLGRHYMPHDVEHDILGFGNRTRKQMFEAAGIKPITVVPRIRHLHEGIEMTRQRFASYWFDQERCERGLECLSSYAYERSDALNDLRPEPAHNWACFTGDTEVLTRYGTRQIIDLPETGEVMTLCGWKRYRHAGMTRKSAQLVEVVFADGYTVRCTPDHLFLTANGWMSAESLTKGTLIRSSLTQSRNTFMAGFIGCGRKRPTMREAGRNYIGRSGNLLLGLCRPSAMSITRMGTQQITFLATLSAFPHQPIYQSERRRETQRSGIERQTARLMATLSLLIGLERKPPSGTDRKPGGYGTSTTPSGQSRGKNGPALLATANTAKSRFLRWIGRMATSKNIAPHPAKQARIASVKHLGWCEDVYCLTVDDGHMFALGNGAIVHNCHAADALRQHAQGFRKGKGFDEPVARQRVPIQATRSSTWIV